MKGEKGITLVALVITLIVLLILAGFTIAVVVNSEWFDTEETNVNVNDQIENGKVDDVLAAVTSSIINTYYTSDTKYADSEAAATAYVALINDTNNTYSEKCSAKAVANGDITITANATSDTKIVEVRVTNGIITITPDNETSADSSKISGWTVH